MSTRTVYIKTALTGGTTDAVDGIDGDTLLDGDVCHVYVSNVAYQYILDDDSGATESSPDVIAPDLNPGDKRWILQTSAHISDDAYAAGWDGETDTAPSRNAVYDALLQTILTTAGDMPYASAANTVARLAKGDPNEKLFMHASNDAPEWDTGIKMRSFTRDMTAATGDVSYSGFGFKPSAILVLTTINNQDNMSIGIADASSERAIVRRASTDTFVDRSAIAAYEPDATNYQRAEVKSWDSDGVTFTWTKTASPTGTLAIRMLAWR